MDNLLNEKINLEISKIENLIQKSFVLLEKTKIQEPDFIELNAIGSVLHSYYNGLESIFKLIYKNLNNKPLQSNLWHSELLQAMFTESENHKQILPTELLPELKNYLGFRHVFRHSYGYELNWERLKPLFSSMIENWQKVKNAILEFQKNCEKWMIYN